MSPTTCLCLINLFIFSLPQSNASVSSIFIFFSLSRTTLFFLFYVYSLSRLFCFVLFIPSHFVFHVSICVILVILFSSLYQESVCFSYFLFISLSKLFWFVPFIMSHSIGHVNIFIIFWLVYFLLIEVVEVSCGWIYH